MLSLAKPILRVLVPEIMISYTGSYTGQVTKFPAPLDALMNPRVLDQVARSTVMSLTQN